MASVVQTSYTTPTQWFSVYTTRAMNNLSRDAERQGNNNNTTERQSNTTQLARNSHFSKKNWLPRVGLVHTKLVNTQVLHRCYQ